MLVQTGESDYPPLPAGDPAPVGLLDYASRAVFDSGRSLTGRTLEMSGFVTPGPDGQPMLARIVLTCCAADGRPIKVGLTGGSPITAAPDTWVQVDGAYNARVGKDPVNKAQVPYPGGARLVGDLRAPAAVRMRRVAVVVALAAGAALLLQSTRPPAAKPPPGRAPGHGRLAEGGPRGHPGNLADGPIFTPALFLDARTAAGTAPSPDARALRLLIRSGDGTLRGAAPPAVRHELEFGTVTAAGDKLVWTESSARGGPQLWTANLRDRAPARPLTADTGNALFYGSQYDLVVSGGRVYWTAAQNRDTEIRSVALTGGPVRFGPRPAPGR